MIPPEEDIDRLADLYGIEKEYYDNWGNLHIASSAAKKAVLKAMGIEELMAALKEKENRPWIKFIEPVSVFSVNEQPAFIPVYFPLKEGQEKDVDIIWHVDDESGIRKSYSQRGISISGFREIEGVRYVKAELPNEQGRETGYYSLSVMCKTPEREMQGGMLLIIAPDRCYVPEGRTWGVSMNLYSLRSKKNWGVGDLGDLKDATVLLKELGCGFIGINPLHAITNTMPYGISPYAPVSRLYRNFIYIDVQNALRELKIPFIPKKLDDKIEKLRDAEFIDYEQTALLKEEVLKEAFLRFKTSAKGGFQGYINAEGEALDKFATYMSICRSLGKCDWRDWPPEFQYPESGVVKRFKDENKNDILFYKFLQWLIDRQLSEAATGAKGMKIGIYGDLAVGSSGGGSDAWGNQDVFASGASAGAPPDAFNPNGQDWGFPPLIPEKLNESRYKLFINTIRENLRHTGALRIDHALGLFRLFWVPEGMTPADGVYVRCPAEDLLRIIALESVRAKAVIIAEDLGTVPPEIKNRLMEIGMLSYRLFYFERQWPERTFSPPEAYPAMSLAAVTTHDLPTLHGYWKGRDIEVKKAIGIYKDGQAHKNDLEQRCLDKQLMLNAIGGLLPEGHPRDARDILEITPEMFFSVYKCLATTQSKLLSVSLDDLSGEIEQQNLPGTIDSHPNWRRKTLRPIAGILSGPHTEGIFGMLRETVK